MWVLNIIGTQPRRWREVFVKRWFSKSKPFCVAFDSDGCSFCVCVRNCIKTRRYDMLKSDLIHWTAKFSALVVHVCLVCWSVDQQRTRTQRICSKSRRSSAGLGSLLPRSLSRPGFWLNKEGFLIPIDPMDEIPLGIHQGRVEPLVEASWGQDDKPNFDRWYRWFCLGLKEKMARLNQNATWNLPKPHLQTFVQVKWHQMSS